VAEVAPTEIGNLWSVHELCSDCVLLAGHDEAPNFMTNKGGSLVFSSKIDGEDLHTTAIAVKGIPKPDMITGAFEECGGPQVYEDQIVCGAIAKLNKLREQ
jgi:hypothetical protein